MSTDKYNNDIDKSIDTDILACLDPNAPKSFFLFAGAGSGKTGTLVNVLTEFKIKYGQNFRIKRQKVAVITYTNAACNEIMHRLDYDTVFWVSTIHSFCWELIQGFDNDIRSWLSLTLKNDIEKLEDEQGRSRDLSNKTSLDRARRIESKTKRLNNLPNVLQFKYDPNSNNSTKDSLNHTEVLGILADFLTTKPLMQDLLVSRFPILLIDESQDTNKLLIDAFFTLQREKKDSFTLGLFGDTMQRIYFDGKENLGEELPADWIVPKKKMNHRSNKRIIKLINTIRDAVDKITQLPRTEKPEGHVRLYIVNRTVGSKDETELQIAQKMAVITADALWIEDQNSNNVKTLILEHHMAAVRIGFYDFFMPLYSIEKLKTGLLDGTNSGIAFFTRKIFPLWLAHKENDDFAIARVVKEFSTKLRKEEMKAQPDMDLIKEAAEKTKSLLELWKNGKDPTLIEILQNVAETGLFDIPDTLSTIAYRSKKDIEAAKAHVSDEEDEDGDQEIDAWDNALSAGFSQFANYITYLSENSKFGTHQGVKGLEFERVMVILDDTESRGNFFSYDKLFGTKALTKTDKDNIAIGKETGIDKTRRLFYVACSRAKNSLAVIVYTDTPDQVKQNAIAYKWFTENEIEILTN